MIASDWRAEYLERYYSGPRDHRARWPRLVEEYTPPGARVLEIGGGPVNWTTSMMRPRAREIVGLDIDPAVKNNNFLDAAVVYDGHRFPLPDARFDIAISRWVNEHLEEPLVHFAEVQRVLRPGGLYVFRTVNLYHYAALVARITPHRIQVPVARWLPHMPAEAHDPYPVYYRINTRGKIVAAAARTGLTPMVLTISEDRPAYGMACRPLFLAFMVYERLVNSSNRLEGLRHTIDCVLKKPTASCMKQELHRRSG
jgi:SAM-dependent methyltransferase